MVSHVVHEDREAGVDEVSSLSKKGDVVVPALYEALALWRPPGATALHAEVRLDDDAVVRTRDQPAAESDTVARIELDVFVVQAVVRGGPDHGRFARLYHHVRSHRAKHLSLLSSSDQHRTQVHGTA